MRQQQLIGGLVLVAGIVLLVAGLRASDSIGSQLSRFFTGRSTDRAVLMTIGGAVLIAGGGAAAMASFRSSRRSSR